MLQSGPDAEAISFGTWLRRQRELREISLREIADVTKISIRYLEALEQDRFDVLPAPVFARGFLREYARFVGLDPDEVVNTYLTAQRAPESEEALPESAGRRARGLERTSGLLLTGAVVALLSGVAGLAYFMERSQSEARPEPPPSAVPPLQQPVGPVDPTASEPSPSIPLLVAIDFRDNCWVEAIIDDSRRISELHVPGESLRLEAQSRVVLTVEDPEAVLVEVNGRPFPISAPAGTVARDIEIDLAKLEAGGAPPQ